MSQRLAAFVDKFTFFAGLTENRERMHRYALMRCRGAVNENVPEVSRFFEFDMSFCDTSEMFSPLQVSRAVSVAPLRLQFYAY